MGGFPRAWGPGYDALYRSPKDGNAEVDRILHDQLAISRARANGKRAQRRQFACREVKASADDLATRWKQAETDRTRRIPFCSLGKGGTVELWWTLVFCCSVQVPKEREKQLDILNKAAVYEPQYRSLAQWETEGKARKRLLLMKRKRLNPM